MDTVEKLLAGAPPRHPLLELPDRNAVSTVLSALGEEKTRVWLQHVWKAHDDEIVRRDKNLNPKWDALTDGWVLPHWWDTVRDLEHCRLYYAGGGRRASKSTDFGWLCMVSWLAYPGGLRWCISDSEKTSQQTQQLQIWNYLPREWKEKLNMKESPYFKLKFQEGRGFTDNLLVLPTQPATTIYFLTIGQKVKDYQGVSLGVTPRSWKWFADASGKPVIGKDGQPFRIPVIGAWIDEDVTMEWLQTAMDRSSDQSAKVLWSFTPLKGVTQAVRETIGPSPKLLESKRAELLPADRKLVKEIADLPPGHMPYRIECARPNTRAIFFFKELNPFSNYALFRDMESKRMDEGTIMREGYGWCRDIRGRKYPRFGPVHQLPTEKFPARGTNYRFIDPHPARPWAMVWVRVWPVAGNRLKRLIYRDWPSMQRFGEWAVPTERAETDGSHKGADGDPGPAQENMGYGIIAYKKAMLDAETIRMDLSGGTWEELDPFRVAILNSKMVDAGFKPDSRGFWVKSQVEDFRSIHPEPIREPIFASYFDPRAMKNPSAGEDGGQTLDMKMAQENRDPVTGELIAPSMIFEGAFTGAGIDEGTDHVNDLLSWDDSSPDGLVTDFNDPSLYVAKDCKQVIWMFEHFTGLGGATGACKEWSDLMRYIAQTDIGHYTEANFKSRGPRRRI